MVESPRPASHGAIDDAGAAKLERIKSLKSLECNGTGITVEGKARLKRALPKLRIW